MILNDKNYNTGSFSVWRKLMIAFRLLSNPFLLILVKLGIKSKVKFLTKSGVIFTARSRTTDVNQAVVVLSGFEYPPELLDLTDLKEPIVLDCGGHIGSFSLYAKHINSSSQLYIIEPFPNNIVMLKQNLALNSIKDAVVVERALSKESGHVEMGFEKEVRLGIGFDGVRIEGVKSKNSVSVQAISLQDLFSLYNIKKVDLLKMDIEGSEYSVIESSIGLLSTKVQRIIMEYHTDVESDGRNKLVNKLCTNNFKLIYESMNVLGFLNTNLSNE